MIRAFPDLETQGRSLTGTNSSCVTISPEHSRFLKASSTTRECTFWHNLTKRSARRPSPKCHPFQVWFPQQNQWLKFFCCLGLQSSLQGCKLSVEGFPCFPPMSDMVKADLFYCLSSPLCSEGIKIFIFYCPLKEGGVSIKAAMQLKVWLKLIKPRSLETSLLLSSLREEYFCNPPACSSIVLMLCSSLIRNNTRCTYDKLFVGPLISAWLCSFEMWKQTTCCAALYVSVR